ncbi:ABC transporter permease [Williamsoniiplasma luminosum]|uniref:ABC transporter permease n=1 Tax=Williamsoniiplasma luminosum TaxID=214888 RepID=A0A2K8NXK5_9MOLU|nr:ABC transporter permease [Williamsoniiplasma luminosum]ATZ17373.1 ABC transporter permease [Williamsoniiplasma luminosum]
MKSKPFIFLLLKQGFKGVFKFKAQFIIILILTFLSTLILGVSISSTRNMQASYDNVVGKVEKFNYQASTEIGKDAAFQNVDVKDFKSMPTIDFNNNDFSYFWTGQPGDSTLKSAFNLKLYAKEGESQTYVTKVTQSPEFINVWNEFINDDANGFRIIASRLWTNQLFWDLHNYTTNDRDEKKHSDLSYLENTAILKAYLNSPDSFKFIKNYTEELYDKSKIYKKETNDNQQIIVMNSGLFDLTFFNQLSVKEKELINYAIVINAQLGQWIRSTIEEFLSPKPAENLIKKTYDQAEKYAFIFGVPLRNAKNELNTKAWTEDKYVTNLQNIGIGSIISADTKATIEKETIQIGETVQTQNEFDAKVKEQILKKGFKGMIIPLVVKFENALVQPNSVEPLTTTDPDQKFKVEKIQFAPGFNSHIFSMLGSGDTKTPIFQRVEISSEFYDLAMQDYTFWNNMDYYNGVFESIKASMLQYHITLDALASGFAPIFRKEAIIFDHNTNNKFRVVVQNSFDAKAANFTLLNGTAPNAIGEITISEQFAKANHVLVGDYIYVGQAYLQVTGFATDAFSYFPAADPSFPMPQPKTEAIIYASADTATLIKWGDGSGSVSQDNTSYTFNYFLTPLKNNQKETIPLTQKLNLFKAFQTDFETDLQTNKFNITNLGKDKVRSYFNPIDFDSSNYRLNWTLLPTVLNIIKAITYSASAIIAIIAMIAMVINIRKTINFNAKEIGILKAMGTSPEMISSLYLATSMIMCLVVIPLAWLLAMGLQLPMTYLIADYFSMPTNQILVDWVSIVIALVVIGIGSIIVSFITALMVTKKPVIDILQSPVKWTNSKWLDKLKFGKFSNASFNLRFSLTLTSSGKKPIFLLVFVVGMTSFLISGALAIPSIANNAVNAFYKSVKYANSYDNVDPIANAPLSKLAINYTTNPEELDKDWTKSNLKLDAQTKQGYGYYKTTDAYSQSNSQTSPLPRYTYFEPKTQLKADGKSVDQYVKYSYDHILKNPGQFLSWVGNIFGNNFFTVVGQTFNIGLVDQFTGLILNSKEAKIREWLGTEYNREDSLDTNKQKMAFQISSALTNSLPSIINAIMGSINSGSSSSITGADWKDKVINVIMAQVPPYIKSYINKSPSRLEQFGVSYNVEQITPKKETLITTVKAKTDKYDEISLTGLDAAQDAFVLKDKQKQALFLGSEEINKIEKILKGDTNIDSFKFDDFEVWNKEKNELTIPMIGNAQSVAAYNLKQNDTLKNISTTTRQITFRNKENQYNVLPKQAWVYDDSDFMNSNLYQKPLETLTGKPSDQDKNYQKAVDSNFAILKEQTSVDLQKHYLDIYQLDNAKFTYNDLYNEKISDVGVMPPKTSLADSAYLFNAFGFDDQQISSSYLRPYYKYANIQLMIPDTKIDDKFLDLPGTRPQDIPQNDKWVKKHVPQNQIPESVQNAWGNPNETYTVIRPYTLDYKKEHGQGLDRLVDGTNSPYWYRYAFDRNETTQGALWYDENQKVDYANSELKINLKNISTIESFDTKLLLIDQGVANAIKGYSNGRTYGYTNHFYQSRKGEIDDQTGETRPWKDKLMTYDFKEAKDDVYVEGEALNNITYMPNALENTKYAARQWHTGKLSNIEEPVGITNGVSFQTRPNIGQYSLGLLSPSGFNLGVSVANQKLLSTQKALINQIYALAIVLGILLIVAIVLTASLLIMLVGDIYITQYKNFMILMRALGYSNFQIQIYAFGVVSTGSLMVWVLGTGLAWIVISSFVFGLSRFGLAIPYGFSWWPPLLSFAITAISFVGALWVSSNKVRNERVSGLMNNSQE